MASILGIHLLRVRRTLSESVSFLPLIQDQQSVSVHEWILSPSSVMQFAPRNKNYTMIDINKDGKSNPATGGAALTSELESGCRALSGFQPMPLLSLRALLSEVGGQSRPCPAERTVALRK